MLNKLGFMLFILAISKTSWCCETNSQGFINLAVSTPHLTYFSYGVNTVKDYLPFTTIKNCQLTYSQNKYVMIALGPEVVDANDKIRGTNFNRQYLESKCSIKNNPLKDFSTYEKRKKIFEKKWKYINECSEVQVTELGKMPLAYPLDQEGCKIKVISPQSVSFNGGYCFFKPRIDSQFKVDLKISERCKSIEGYKNSEINLQDISGDISFYTSKEYIGDLIDLDALSSTSIRLSTNPLLPVIKPNDDFGVLKPLFPADFALNDIHLGKIEFNPFTDQFVEIATPFVVSNICSEIKIDGIKSSYCDYAIPFAAEIFLKNEKGESIYSWFDGGVASAQWQGIINGQGFQIAKEMLPTGKNYELEVVFSDPYFDFNYFKKRIQSKINSTRIPLPSISKDGSINEIPEVRKIEELESIPTIDPIDIRESKDTLAGVNKSRKRLEEFFSTTMFPPIYEQACILDKGICQKFKKYFLKFKANFYLNPDYSISKLKIKRDSKLLEPYEKEIAIQPEYQCN